MPTLLVIGDEQTPNRAHDVVRRAARYWEDRGEPSPSIEYRTFPSVLEDSARLASCDVALVLLSAQVSEALVYQLIGYLDDASTPSIVLENDRAATGEPARSLVDPSARDGLSAGCIFARACESVESLSAMLYAMAHRQPTVREMQQGLRAAKSIQTEAAAELDRLHDEMLLAAQVQREVLPKHMPQVKGLSLGVLFRPAGFVSGDIYDIDRLDEDHVGFFLADAMGHGVPAALMTLFISGSLPQKEVTGSRYRLIPPAESLAMLNKSMCASRVGSTRFATAVCGQIHVPTGRVRLASAGHPPALVLRDGNRRAIDLDGPLLGVFDDATFEECTFTLEPEERLVVHSDGLEEAYSPRNLSEDTTHACPTRHIDAMTRLSKECGTASMAEFIAKLAEDMDSQAGSMHQHDDVSVVGFARE